MLWGSMIIRFDCLFFKELLSLDSFLRQARLVQSPQCVQVCTKDFPANKNLERESQKKK